MRFTFPFAALLALSVPVFAQSVRQVQNQQVQHVQVPNGYPSPVTKTYLGHPAGFVYPTPGVKRYENGVLVTPGNAGAQVAVVAPPAPVVPSVVAASANEDSSQSVQFDAVTPTSTARPSANPMGVYERPDTLWAYGASRSPGTQQTTEEMDSPIRLDIEQEGLDPGIINVRITNQGLQPYWVLKYGIARDDGLVDDFFSNIGPYSGRVHREFKETNIAVNTDNFYYLTVDQSTQHRINLHDFYDIPRSDNTPLELQFDTLTNNTAGIESLDAASPSDNDLRSCLLTAFLQYISAEEAPDIVFTPCQLRGLRVLRQLLLRTGGQPTINRDTVGAAENALPEIERGSAVNFDTRSGQTFPQGYDPYARFNQNPSPLDESGSEIPSTGPLPDALGPVETGTDVGINADNADILDIAEELDRPYRAVENAGQYETTALGVTRSSIDLQSAPIYGGTGSRETGFNDTRLNPGVRYADIHINNIIPLPPAGAGIPAPPERPLPEGALRQRKKRSLNKRAEPGALCNGPNGDAARSAFAGAASLCSRASSFALVAPVPVMRKYFGSGAADIRTIVSERFAAIAAAAADPDIVTYNCGDQLGYCGTGDTSYSINAQNQFYMCPLFFQLPPSGGGCDDSTQVGVVLHELSHFESVYSPATGDSAYGPACFSLDANTAVNNADTYELFAQALGSGCIG